MFQSRVCQFDGVVMRYKVTGQDRYGLRVARVVEAASVEEAREQVRAKGYVPRKIEPLASWRFFVWCGLGLALALAVVTGCWLVAPGLGFAVAVAVCLMAAVGYHFLQTQRQSAAQAQQQHAARMARVEADRLREAALKREEAAIDRAVQTLLAELNERRREWNETQCDLEELEPTVDDAWKVDELQRRLRQKQAEIETLERELAELIPTGKSAGKL